MPLFQSVFEITTLGYLSLSEPSIYSSLYQSNFQPLRTANILSYDSRETDLKPQLYKFASFAQYYPSESIEPEPEPEPIKIFVRQIEVTGSTVFDAEDFDPIVKSFEGRELTLEELRQVADEITQLYINRGYITSIARPVSQTIENGVIEIRVTEGRLSNIEIEGTKRLNSSYIRSRIELGANVPLNVQKLEDQLRLLRINPLFNNVEASLRPGGEVGESILIVRVEESRRFYGGINIDNYSPPSVGGERTGISLGFQNITGLGDEVSASYSRSTTGGTDVYDFAYRVPINAKDGTILLRVSPNRNRVTQDPFEELDIRGTQARYEFAYRQPIIRNPREELALSLSFALQNGQTFVFEDVPRPFVIGPDEDGNSRTRVIKLGQDYLKRDSEGSWSLRSQFNFGIDVFDATVNDSPIPDSRFFSWLGQVQRVQLVDQNNLIIVRGDLQLSADSLLPAEQFVIGGGKSVRGYRQNLRTGDNGFRFSIEDRITVKRNSAGDPIIQISPFFEMGSVWNQVDNPNKLPRQTFLVSTGFGFLWDPFFGLDGLSLRLDYGFPLVDFRDRGDNIQDDGIYFSINYRF
ncbi:surface antigen family protein [Lyngbya aestuarii BL J]|uniref:Surface antigen family protein n=1 Tax=Lyngbya aestuarii BL J TaxID=1348334 RepID=U7QEW0_9CYAN|nr:ShlB/FhaC/HecB family hemolysin secretion/activation protein [Lyngbya aestuarii]ERT05620.1 surface antigen family protein [Lyngbya aestuarii BL J]